MFEQGLDGRHLRGACAVLGQTDGLSLSVCPIYALCVACEFGGNVIDVLFVMDTNRGIWDDEEAFLGLFKGVAKERGTSSGNFPV